MQHYVYYNEPILMDRKSCLTIKKKLLKKQGHLSTDRIHFRRVFFQMESVSTEYDDIPEDNTDLYSIYTEMFPHVGLTYLEKISKRGAHIHHQREPLSKEQSELLLSGQYDWLSSEGLNLFYELYLQVTINKAAPGKVYDYKRELISLGKADRILVLDKSVQWAEFHSGISLQGDNFEFNLLRGKDHIQGNYRKNVSVPPIFSPLIEDALLPLSYNC